MRKVRQGQGAEPTATQTTAGASEAVAADSCAAGDKKWSVLGWGGCGRKHVTCNECCGRRTREKQVEVGCSWGEVDWVGRPPPLYKMRPLRCISTVSDFHDTTSGTRTIYSYEITADVTAADTGKKKLK